MIDLQVSEYLPILTIGLWVGVFMTFVAKMLAFVISKILSWFKMA